MLPLPSSISEPCSYLPAHPFIHPSDSLPTHFQPTHSPAHLTPSTAILSHNHLPTHPPIHFPIHLASCPFLPSSTQQSIYLGSLGCPSKGRLTPGSLPSFLSQVSETGSALHVGSWVVRCGEKQPPSGTAKPAAGVWLRVVGALPHGQCGDLAR